MSIKEAVNIPISRLVKDPMNMRKDPEDVSDPVGEIRTHGWTVPLVVRPLKDGKYGVVSGSRRLHAARLLGIEQVPCIVKEMDDDEALRRSFEDERLHFPLTYDERVSYYKLMIERAGGLRAASKKYKIPKETMRENLIRYELQHLLKSCKDQTIKRAVGSQANLDGIMSVAGKRVKGLPKKYLMIIAKEVVMKAASSDGKSKSTFWQLDRGFLSSLKKDVQEKIQSIASKVWEPKVFRLKPKAPALHEFLQKPAILEAISTNSWPTGWKPIPVEPHGLRILIPSYELGGDFTGITVLLCPSCGMVLRGLGKGLPVVCLDCGFPCTESSLGWGRENEV